MSEEESHETLLEELDRLRSRLVELEDDRDRLRARLTLVEQIAREERAGLLQQLADTRECHDRDREQWHIQKLDTLGVLAGGLAHEFNNLLTAIQGYTELVRDEMPLGSPPRNHLNAVLTASARGAELIRQILAYSGRSQLVLRRVNLGVLVCGMAETLGRLVAPEVKLEFDHPVELPLVEGDEGQLRQVVTNLVRNASEAIGKQGGRITLRTGVRLLDQGQRSHQPTSTRLSPGRYVFLEVIDNGPGMDEATLTRIFDPFFTTRSPGRGLGLAAVQGIVRAHKGLVGVTSAPVRGSTFEILLPATDHVTAVPNLTRRPALLERGPVLVMEDEEGVRSLIRLILHQAGYRVIVAADGQEGLDTFARDPASFSLAIVDLTMPRLGGLDVLPCLRQSRTDLPVIMMTGYCAADLLGKLTGLQVTGLVQKPFTAPQLLGAVRKALGVKRGG